MDGKHIDDPDNPEWTPQDFARARPASEVHPPEIVRLLVRQDRRSKIWTAIDHQQPLFARGWRLAA